tara:strand:+ start:376 stop:882 length:507 start_codon:yes stop_codon:yes gene_type:complete
MTDLTKYGHDFDAEVEAKPKIAEGRHNMTFVSDEIVTGNNGWEAVKLSFEIEGTTMNVSYTCTMAHDTSDKAISIGIESLRKIGNACGVTGTLTNPEKQLLGKKCSAELVVNDRGYLEIKSDFGNTFQPVEKAANKKQSKKEQIKAEADFVKKASADTDDDFDDEIPF